MEVESNCRCQLWFYISIDVMTITTSVKSPSYIRCCDCFCITWDKMFNFNNCLRICLLVNVPVSLHCYSTVAVFGVFPSRWAADVMIWWIVFTNKCAVGGTAFQCWTESKWLWNGDVITDLSLKTISACGVWTSCAEPHSSDRTGWVPCGEC